MSEKEIKKLERLAKVMDDIVRVPGTNIRIGLDSLTGFVPVIGDFAGLIPAIYIVSKSRKLGVSNHATGRMVFNSLIDFAIGSVPLIGDIFDIGWNANLRNVAILRNELERKKLQSAERDGLIEAVLD
ncbi:DUF4112 domain-containing protein [Parasulfitobacter algicola]|uniref:DUF4112 domain-containing protein n=1 Tax=Parasulfitobacter algicola TaxID=2614809 RepID=A0ABX2IY12_9RHOB|nr:DUF4112 domain-containing protein [Sulfitobacter algicola]NSX55449.1 DUF4112 domain-containing protein [Sulfitobacter algicola]